MNQQLEWPTEERIREALEAIQATWERSPTGNSLVFHRTGYFFPVAAGGTLINTGTVDVTVPENLRAEATDVVESWHRIRWFPKATCSTVSDDGTFFRVHLESAVYFVHGVSDEQLQAQLRSYMGAADELAWELAGALGLLPGW